jgi:hypothetical protein
MNSVFLATAFPILTLIFLSMSEIRMSANNIILNIIATLWNDGVKGSYWSTCFDITQGVQKECARLLESVPYVKSIPIKPKEPIPKVELLG